MGLEEQTWYTPVCEQEGCDWRGNATPNEEDAQESLEDHNVQVHQHGTAMEAAKPAPNG